MLLRVSGSACCKMRLTTPAGISSTMSTASSRYSSSSTSFSSVLENPRIRISCSSLSSSTNTSAASSLGSRRNTRMGARASSLSHSHAMSAASMGSRRSRSWAYRLRDTRSSTCSVSSSHLFSDSNTPRDLLSKFPVNRKVSNRATRYDWRVSFLPEKRLCGQFPPTVQALASQGDEIALDDTFLFDIACSYPLMMSPSLRGSDPYPCGSLTYRTIYTFSL